VTAQPTQQAQQAEFERLVTRIAQRAADNVSGPVADLGCKLALAQETAEGQAAALAEKDQQLAGKDAELARARQVADDLWARIVELEDPPPAAAGGDTSDA
jgi:hypothetical protein